MKPGQTIIIYSDPIGCTMVEGTAKLISFVQKCEELEQWKVEFYDCEGSEWLRWIKPI